MFLSKILHKNHHPGQESEDQQSTFYNHGSLWWSYWFKPYPNFYGSELLIIKGWSRKLARRYPPIPTWGGVLLRCWHYCQNISLWISLSRTEHPSDGRPRLSRAIPSTLPVLVVADGEDSASLSEHARFQCQKSATQIGATKKIEPLKPTWTLKPSLKKHCKQFPTLAGWNQYCASKHTLSWLSPCLLFSHSAVVRTRCIQDKSCCFTCAWQMSKLIWAVRFLQLDHPTIRRYRGLSQDEAMPPARCDLPNLRGSGVNGLVSIWRRGKGLNTRCISYM